jgi:AcrR family transcriptional regulator
MARIKTISDTAILAIVLARLLRGGEKAVSFREVARATGLSAPALVLRFTNHAGMMTAALTHGWADLTQKATDTAKDMGGGLKDAQDLLKAQSEMMDIAALLTHSLRNPQASLAANAYRETIEDILAKRYGGGAKGRNAAGVAFAAWQGRLAWGEAGGKSFRFGELLRSLD